MQELVSIKLSAHGRRSKISQHAQAQKFTTVYPRLLRCCLLIQSSNSQDFSHGIQTTAEMCVCVCVKLTNFGIEPPRRNVVIFLQAAITRERNANTDRVPDLKLCPITAQETDADGRHRRQLKPVVAPWHSRDGACGNKEY